LARPHFRAVFNLAAVLCLWGSSGLAANISLSQLGDDPAHARVAVDGRFEAGDEIKFRTEVGRLTKAVVVFNSDGGVLQAGIEIGKTIRLKSFATAVLDGSRCASSCAFAWLGGSPRFMQRGAQIGFHAAYVNREGRPSESGVGNALVGSYLTQIGLPETAVIYVTKAAPTQLTFLTFQDAQRIGIEVLPFEQYAPTTEPAQRITPRGHQELALECGVAQSTPRDDDPDPIYKTKIAVTDQVIYVEHYAASGKTFSRNEQYRDQRFWRAENTDNWSGVSVKRPDRTMVGTIRTDKGGQRVEYTEKVYRGGKLEVTIVSVCRLIRTTATPQTPSPGEKPQSQTRCQVTDPTGTPLNVRAAPNGHIIGTLGNGDLVRLIRTERDGGGRAWSLIERLNDSQASGWVFRQYLVCQRAEKPQPLALPERQRQTWPLPDSYEAICFEANSGNALSACTRLIDGGRTGFYFWRAQIYFTNGDYDRVIEDLSAFIRLNPNWSALPYYNRGFAYEKKGELNKALTDFREALNKGSTTVSEDINRVERAIASLRSK
jgi:tetratricopeptide (TPR) repeat protein